MKKRKRAGKLRRFLKRLGTLDIVLICVFAYMIIFNQQMISLYGRCGSAPESAWCAIIAALIGECGICGWIRTTKDKQKDREQEQKTRKKAPQKNTGQEEPTPEITPEDVGEIINGLEDENNDA